MSKSISSQFDKWKKDNDQHGKSAFPRFIMLKFLENLSAVSEDFVFKGGNLLWHYIQTPRSTVDLDFCTLTLKSHKEVREVFEKAIKQDDNVEYLINEFLEIGNDDSLGCKVSISFKAINGQKNKFSIDVVYAIPTDLQMIKSSISSIKYKAASIENIIADKVQASFTFGSGNTRMKDFDDLWRLSRAEKKLDREKLNLLFKEKNIDYKLDIKWSIPMVKSWKGHCRSYKDLPKNIEEVFQDINKWLAELKL
ncbi:hypothetical protein A9Q84_14730 [Halobacteriovorax marinus]|uniref:Nucleotidyl transferase AbiEii/AbiGii toxin family protein n=1 Tax=Halobacteriovorax marinus TaxID=97084 RepID=A0A1Y5FAT8_9BACT|nr:hypothetical protein A9Q84_14730 [Halobacteriovorax marinus]